MTYSTGAVLGASTSAVLAYTGVPFNYMLMGFGLISLLMVIGFTYDTYLRR